MNSCGLKSTILYFTLVNHFIRVLQKNRTYNLSPPLFFKSMNPSPLSQQDDRCIATINFLKHLDEPAIGNDECYARCIELVGSMKS